jgi:hypothetical protein
MLAVKPFWYGYVSLNLSLFQSELSYRRQVLRLNFEKILANFGMVMSRESEK